MANCPPPIMNPTDIELVRRHVESLGIYLTDEDVREVSANLVLLTSHSALLNQLPDAADAGGKAV